MGSSVSCSLVAAIPEDRPFFIPPKIQGHTETWGSFSPPKTHSLPKKKRFFLVFSRLGAHFLSFE